MSLIPELFDSSPETLRHKRRLEEAGLHADFLRPQPAAPQTVPAAGYGSDDPEDLRPAQYQRDGTPILYGEWKTVGSVGGKGGTHVYIENGRVTRGHPSLVGRRISSLSQPEHDTTHRTDWDDLARAEGIDPRAMHRLAGDILANDHASQADVKRLLQAARQTAYRSGFGDLYAAVRQAQKAGSDHAQIRGFDDVAKSMADMFPHFFAHGDDADHGQRLFDLVTAGTPRFMTQDDALEEALAHLQSKRERQPGEDRDEPASAARAADEEAVPFGRTAAPKVGG